LQFAVKPSARVLRLLDFELGEAPAVGLVVLAGIVSGVSLLHSGYPGWGDIWPNMVRVRATYQALLAGHQPSWSFYFYQGYPLLRFYSPLFFWVSGLFCFPTGGDPFAAVKITIFLMHVASGIAVFYLARSLLKDSAAAFIAAVAYLFCYWHVFWVTGMGRLPVALIFLLMPLCLWRYERLFERPTLSRGLAAGIVLGLMPLTHIFYAFYWIPLLILWLLPAWLRQVRSVNCEGRGVKFTLHPSPFTLLLLVSAVAAFGVSACFTIPFLIEGPHYLMPQPSLPVAGPSALVMLGLAREVSGYTGTYVGLSILLLAVCGIVLHLRTGKEKELEAASSLQSAKCKVDRGRETEDGRTPPVSGPPSPVSTLQFAVCSLQFAVNRPLDHSTTSRILWPLALSILLSFSAGLPLVKALPMAGELSTDRFLVFVLLFLTLLAGFGYRCLRERLGIRWLWAPVLALILLDLGPQVFSNVYRARGSLLAEREYVYRRLAGKQDGRLLDVVAEGADPNLRFTRYPANGYLFAGLSSVLGPPYHQFAPSSMFYAYAWSDDVAREFLDSTQSALSYRALQELRLMDVKYLVTLPTHKSTESGMTYVFLKQGLIWDDSLLRVAIAEQNDGRRTTASVTQPLAIGTFPSAAPIVVASSVVHRSSFINEKVDAEVEEKEGSLSSPLPLPLLVPLYTYYVAPDWQQLPEEMGLNPITGVARRIFTPEEVKAKVKVKAQPLPLPVPSSDSTPVDSELRLALGGFKQTEDRVELQVAVSGDCFARLAYSYYPELQVRVDGAPVPDWETADHCVLIRLLAGSHAIVIEPRTTPVRRITMWVSAAVLVLSLLWIAASSGKRRPEIHPD
jgi:hypothetical protein